MDTEALILSAALSLFLKQGIKKTSVDEIAQEAGVTRVTVYRYFADKQDLVKAVFLRVERIFQQANQNLRQNPAFTPEQALDQIGQELGRLPAGDLIARLDELKHLYPAVYAEFQAVRLAALEEIFDRLFARAERDGLLRASVNRDVAQAVFWALVVNAFDNPHLAALGLSGADLYRAIVDILLYGLFQTRSE